MASFRIGVTMLLSHYQSDGKLSLHSIIARSKTSLSRLSIMQRPSAPIDRRCHSSGFPLLVPRLAPHVSLVAIHSIERGAERIFFRDLNTTKPEPAPYPSPSLTICSSFLVVASRLQEGRDLAEAPAIIIIHPSEKVNERAPQRTSISRRCAHTEEVWQRTGEREMQYDAVWCIIIIIIIICHHHLAVAGNSKPSTVKSCLPRPINK